MSLRPLGALPTDIRRHAAEQGWGVSERQLQRYTAQADMLMAKAVDRNRDRLMAYQFAARRALYARAVAVSAGILRSVEAVSDAAWQGHAL